MLDNLAVKIDDIKRAIGSVGEKDRMKPGVGGGEDLTIGLVRKTAGNELRAVRVEPAAGDEVLHLLATERIAGVSRAKPGGAVQARPAPGGRIARRLRDQQQWRHDRIKPRVVAGG